MDGFTAFYTLIAIKQEMEVLIYVMMMSHEYSQKKKNVSLCAHKKQKK